jgi:hypothetical protein
MALEICVRIPLGGGVVMFDALRTLDQDLLSSLAIAIDPRGNSELVGDFGAENWSDVWQRETALLHEVCAKGDMAVDLLSSGNYYIQIDTETISGEGIEQAWPILDQQYGLLNVVSGRLAIAEIGSLVSFEMQGAGELQRWELAVKPGQSVVCIKHLRPQKVDDVVMGDYWGAGKPAIVIEFAIGKPQRNQSSSNFWRFDSKRVSGELAAVNRREAQVKKVEGAVAIASIMVSPGVYSGYALVSLRGTEVKIGDRIRIFLEHKIDGRWRATLLEKL